MIPEALKTLWSRYLPNRTERYIQSRDRRTADRPLMQTLSKWYKIDEPLESDTQAPVFILSASWRSGSTLLQRLICSTDQLLIWGEPYGRCALVPRLASSLSCFTADWPRPEWFFDESRTEKLEERWIANLYPSPADLQAAHRAFFDRLFAEPAKKHGYAGWGLKEIRFGSREIDYLRWLYPYSKFILLVRDPRAVWLSYKGRIWHDRWPDRPVYSVTSFARMWQRIADDFLQYAKMKRIMLLHYEDLRPDTAPLDEMERLLGLKPDATVLENKIRGVDRRTNDIPRIERTIIADICGETAYRLGYDLR